MPIIIKIIMPRARLREGAAPANQTKKIMETRENFTARLFFPNIEPICKAARLTKETCIPERAKTWASPAFLKASETGRIKKSLFAERRAKSKAPALPHPDNKRIR